MWLFLLLALPFGIYDNNFSNFFYLLLFLLPFGLIWIVISYSVDYLVNHIFSFKADESYRIDFIVFLLKLFLLVHLAFTFRGYLCSWQCVDLYEYIELWFASILMLSLVYIPFSLYARSRFYHKMVGVNISESEDLIELKGEGKETFNIRLDNIIYFKSDDNYVDIVMISQDVKHKKLVFRATLKSIEDQLTSHSQFIRVHRSFIVNLRYTIDLGKKDTIKVKNGDLEFEMPISKKYQEDLMKIVV